MRNNDLNDQDLEQLQKTNLWAFHCFWAYSDLTPLRPKYLGVLASVAVKLRLEITITKYRNYAIYFLTSNLNIYRHLARTGKQSINKDFNSVWRNSWIEDLL